MKYKFILINKNVPFVFVVQPTDLRIQSAQLKKNVEIIDFGEISNIGKNKVTNISFSTFLPSLKSNFFSLENPLPPQAGVELLKKWKENSSSLKFIVPEAAFFYKCKIENLNIILNENTGDITVDLMLVEEREQNKITDSITGLFKR